MQSISKAGANYICPWMLSRKADLLIFFLPVPVALAFFLLSQSSLVSKSMFWAAFIACGMAIGPFHQGPTLFTYFNKENRAYYSSSRRNICIFYLMPPLLVLTSIAAALASPLSLFIVVSLWHIQHLVQQNIRILSIYHVQDNTVKQALPDRDLEATTQWAAAIVFTLISCSRTNFIGLQWLPGLNVLIGALSVWFVIRCANYLLSLQKQVKAGYALNVPALLFWLVSVLSMLPVACLGTDFFAPFVIPLMIHWFHFIGLNIYLVQGRAQASSTKTKADWSPVIALLTFSSLYMLVYVFFQKAADPGGAQLECIKSIALGIVMGLGMCHYFLDTYIWRFDLPYQKENILPFIHSNKAESQS